MGTTAREIHLEHPSEKFKVGMDKDNLQAGCVGIALSGEWKSPSIPLC